MTFDVQPIAVIGCGKEKLSTPARAEDLYVGPVFRARLALAKAHADVVFIASAQYGLIPSTQIVRPYELDLATMPRSVREAWADDVARHLRLVLHASQGPILALVSGPYAAWVPTLRAEGVDVRTVGEGLPVGRLRQALALELAS